MDIDAHRALRMFQAIVAQAAHDATASDNVKFSRKPLRRRTAETDAEYEFRNAQALKSRHLSANRPRTEARNWLLGNSPDFRMIASLAGYNPDDVLERSVRQAALGWPRRVKEAEFALAA